MMLLHVKVELNIVREIIILISQESNILTLSDCIQSQEMFRALIPTDLASC